jgi:hypothetical protein
MPASALHQCPCLAASWACLCIPCHRSAPCCAYVKALASLHRLSPCPVALQCLQKGATEPPFGLGASRCWSCVESPTGCHCPLVRNATLPQFIGSRTHGALALRWTQVGGFVVLPAPLSDAAVCAVHGCGWRGRGAGASAGGASGWDTWTACELGNLPIVRRAVDSGVIGVHDVNPITGESLLMVRAQWWWLDG